MRVSLIIYALLLLLPLGACNSSVFIDEAAVSAGPVILDGDAINRIKLQYSPDELEFVVMPELLGCKFEKELATGEIVTDQASAHLFVPGIDRCATLSNGLFSFMISVDATTANTLELVASGNYFGLDLHLALTFEYSYGIFEVPVTIGQSTPFEVKNISYDLMRVDTVFSETRIVDVFEVHNSQPTPQPYVVRPFAKTNYTARFESSLMPVVSMLGQKPVEVAIPSINRTQTVMAGRKAVLSVKEHIVEPVGNLHMEHTIEIPPQSDREYSVFVDFNTYSVPFVIEIENPATKKALSYSGACLLVDPVRARLGYRNLADNDFKY